MKSYGDMEFVEKFTNGAKNFWQTDPRKSSWMDNHPVLNQSHLECLNAVSWDPFSLSFI